MGKHGVLLAALIGACAFDSAGVDSGAGASATTGAPGPMSTSGVPNPTTGMSSAASGDGTMTAAESSETSSPSTTMGGTTTSDGTGSSGGGESTGEPVSPWCDPAEPDLAACYAFADLGSGALVDDSATGNDGTVNGVGIEAGPLGDAAVFSDGSQISVPAHPATDFDATATLELLVRIDQIPGAGRVGLLDRDGQWSVFLYADGGLRCGASEFVFWDALTTDAWMHVGCVIGGGYVRLYVDGELVSEIASNAPIATGSGQPLAIGDNSPTFDEPLTGAIGGVRLWSVVRTAEQLCEGAGELCAG